MSAFHDISDEELLRRYYAEGNSEWLGRLLERYTLLLLGVCMKYLKDETEAREAVQAIFLKVLTEAPRHQITYFKSWLYMVAKNHCLMKLRGEGARSFREITDSMALSVPEGGREEHQQLDQRYDQLESALEELSGEQRQCIILFYLQKKSYGQISEQTGYTPMQVKSYIQNGKRNLRLIMERKGQGGPRS